MRKAIGHYEIISELGRGGMGVVYKAHEQSLNRYVAIKMLGDQVVGDPNIRARFLREARSAAALNHPNIIQIYFVGEDGGCPYFAMEYVEGVSLAGLIRQERQLPPKRAAGILLQAASGLARAHDQGIIHRDIKPGNIMIDPHGLVKLADFGIAHVMETGEKLTATGQFLGTPGYLSPEVCLGKPVGAQSDIFSLGIVFYEMLTGATPFRADSPLAMLREVVELEIPDPRALNQAVDVSAHLILSNMVAKSLEARYPNCHALVKALKEYLAGEDLPLTLPDGARASGPTVRPTAPLAPVHGADAPTVRVDAQGTAPLTVPQVGNNQPTAVISAEGPKTLHTPPASATVVVPPPPPPRAPVPPPAGAVQPPPRQAAASRGRGGLIALPAVAACLAVAAFGAWWFLGRDTGAEEPAGGHASALELPKETGVGTETHGNTGEVDPEDPTRVAGAGVTPNGAPESAGETPDVGEIPPGEEMPDPAGRLPADPEAPPVQPLNASAANLPGQPGPAHGNGVPVDDASGRESAPGTAHALTSSPGKTGTGTAAHETPGGAQAPAPAPTAAATKTRPAAKPTALPAQPKLVVAATGDAQLARPVRHYLQEYLAEAGYSVDTTEAAEGADPVALGRETAAQGHDVLVLVEVTYLDERQLNYMGRSSAAYRAEIVCRSYWADGDKRLGRDQRKVVEYTAVNAERKGEETAGDLVDGILAGLR